MLAETIEYLPEMEASALQQTPPKRAAFRGACGRIRGWGHSSLSIVPRPRRTPAELSMTLAPVRRLLLIVGVAVQAGTESLCAIACLDAAIDGWDDQHLATTSIPSGR
jgi:hypothetical protein